jgi:phage/plasmid-associated DNA primase
MTNQNFFVPSVDTPLTKDQHVSAADLIKLILHHDGSEAYHGAFNLEERDTFKGYEGATGPAMGYAWFDFDSSQDGGASAWEDCKKFLQWLGVPDALVFFSGNKGFHVGVPAGYTGVTGPKFNQGMHRIARILSKEYPTLDTAVYNASRLFRVPGSKHPKTGLYKYLLGQSVHVLANLQDAFETIRDFAKGPTHSLFGVAEERAPLKQLVELSESRGSGLKLVSAAEQAAAAPDSNGVVDAFARFEGKLCIQKMIRSHAPEGHRHNIALRIASDLFNTHQPYEKAILLLQEWCKNNRIVEMGDVVKILDQVYSGQYKYSFGCNDEYKAANCSGKCKVYRMLSPETRPVVADAPNNLLVQNRKAKKPSEEVLARQLLESFDGSLVKQERNLFRYDGKRWVEVRETDRDRIKRALIELYDEADIKSHDVESAYKMMMYYVPEVPQGMNLFAPNPLCANFLNGTLHLLQDDDYEYSLVFRPHNREDYITNLLPYEYKEGDETKNDAFLEMLDRVFEGDSDKAEKIRAVQQMYGACLMPVFPHFWFLVGVPGTGKSTVILLADKLVSPENTCSVEPHQFNGFNMETMVGKLVNLETDVTTNAEMSDAALKKVLDRRLIRIPRKYEKDAYGRLPGVHIFGGNGIPATLEGAHRAHDRRWTFIEFKRVQTNGRYNKEFHAWVYEQSPQGLLNFALAGLRDLMKARFHYVNPESGKRVMDEWQTADDPVEIFLRDARENEVVEGAARLVVQTGAKLERTRLFDAFKGWAEKSGYRTVPVPRSKFYTALKARGVVERKVEGVRYVDGFDLVSTPNPPY